MTEYIVLAIVVALIAFVLLYWFKKTPRSVSTRQETEMLAEKEGKLFKLYQNLEDMMDSFESFVEEETQKVSEQRAMVERVEERVTSLTERIEIAAQTAEEHYLRATHASEKAERLAARAASDLRKQIAADKEEEERQDSRPERTTKDVSARPAERREAAPAVQRREEPRQPEVRNNPALEPIVARPAVEPQRAEKEQAAPPKKVQAPLPEMKVVKPEEQANVQVPFQPMEAQAVQHDNAAQAELIKQIAAVQQQREAERVRREKAMQQVEMQRPATPQAAAPTPQADAAPAHFETVLPEYDMQVSQEAIPTTGYHTYSRPVPINAAAMTRMESPAQPTMMQPAEGLRKQQVLEMHNGGMDAEQISRELGVAKGAVSFIIDLQQKVQ